MKTEKVSILAGADHVSGIISVPDRFYSNNRTGVIIAHGAGNDMNNPLIIHVANGLAGAGMATLRFNFPYSEKGRKSPDTQKKLVQTWQSVYRFFNQNYDPDKVIAAGKSMGGRVASQMVAEGLLPVDRLIFLGYPLHPPNKKDQLRDAHLYNIRIPMLFFAGTRDALCDLGLLKKVLERLKSQWSLEIIDSGDHSFNIPKSFILKQQEVYDQVLEKTIAWFSLTLSGEKKG